MPDTFKTSVRPEGKGIELTMGRRIGKLGLTARYSLIDATYQSSFLVNSPHNSTADANGAIQVRPGNRIPGIAQNSLKLRVDFEFDEQVSAGANFVFNSSNFARGDENNQGANGKIAGYASSIWMPAFGCTRIGSSLRVSTMCSTAVLPISGLWGKTSSSARTT